MAWLDVTIKGRLQLDDDPVEPFKVQDMTDQIRGFLDEGQDFTVAVKRVSQPAQKTKDEALAAAETE